MQATKRVDWERAHCGERLRPAYEECVRGSELRQGGIFRVEVSVRVRGVRGEYVYLFDLSLSPAASFIRTSYIDSCCHEGANLQVCRTE